MSDDSVKGSAPGGAGSIDPRGLENALRSPLRLWLMAELVRLESEPIALAEAAVRSGRHVQDVEACLRPMLRWGVVDRVAEGYRLASTIPPALRVALQRALSAGAPRVERERKVRRHVLGGMIGVDPKMQMVFEMIRQVARIDVPVLVTGETGTGKEMVARAIHVLSGRRRHEFGAINCATLTDPLFGSVMFGHVRGAFTGAVRNHVGLFERCHQGSVFLDEVGDLSLANQVRLLRVLQERTFTRVGDERTRASDFRIICATNRDLTGMVDAGLFREDLFYRLNVFPMRIPSLRERRADVPYLVSEIIEERLKAYHVDGEVPRVTAEAMTALCAYEWPGNVRQLENVLMRSVVLASGGPVQRRHLTGMVGAFSDKALGPAAPVRPREDLRSLAEVERDHIEHIMALKGGNVSAAAKILEVSRTTLYKKLRDYGLGERSSPS